MTTVTIRGVPINFPFEPYELQKDYMEKVLECLQNETNGVLESPTGTGKTLSLLCSSLAWLQIKKAQLQVQRETAAFNENDEFVSKLNDELEKTAGKTSGRAFLGLPTIIYASRTHSQLSQAMQELKRTAYKDMKACVLGSRDQLCINPEVMGEQTVSNKIQMCLSKVKTRSCPYYNRVERKRDDPALRDLSVIDIEDLLKLGNCYKFCPYYMAKELKQQADIVFMPYNYILDPLSRKALGVDLSNNVIILDEAHNIEKMCEDSASFQIKSSDIALAIEEATAIMKMMSSDVSLDFNSSPKDFSEEDLCVLKQILLDFEKEMDNIKLNDSSDGTTFEGNYIFELLSKSGVIASNFNLIINLISKITLYLATVGDGPFARRGIGLQLFEGFLGVVFVGSSEEFRQKVKQCYKVHVVEEEVKKKTPSNWLSKATAKPGGRILNYWCFSPSFGMNMLMALGMKCVILTSGTLSPLQPLISELGLDVQVRLENPHIVKSNQVCVKIIPAGPDKEVLNCNFQNRDNPNYLGSLGRSILNICRVVPNGLLIFFPSYPIMKKCQDHWQETGLWSNINALKAIYVEPRDKASFNQAMDEFYSKVRDPNLKGAIFMGVCRGKVSEGLDFVDANGRAVIITGLPFPPIKDPKIILKKRYLDQCNAVDKQYLKGDEWYCLEASRAVNQAIGRVIRHQHDYGAILLLDTRFDNFRVKSRMSLWLRDYVKVAGNFGEVMRDLRIFFKNAEASCPTPQAKSKSMPAEFEMPTTYKKNNFDFSTSSISTFASSSGSGSSIDGGEVVIHKRTRNDPLANPTKRLKINVVPNSTNANDLGTTPKEYILMVRKTLDGPSFSEFARGLGVYRETSNFNELTKILDTIFRDKHHLRFLLQGIEPYVKEDHKEDFQKYWEIMR